MITYYNTEYTQKEEDNCKRKKNKSKNDRKDQINKKKVTILKLLALVNQFKL